MERMDIMGLVGTTILSLERKGAEIIINLDNGEALQCTIGYIFDKDGNHFNMAQLPTL